jgi:hypothetical protein
METQALAKAGVRSRTMKLCCALPVGEELAGEALETNTLVVLHDGLRNPTQGEARLRPTPAEFAVLRCPKALIEPA